MAPRRVRSLLPFLSRLHYQHQQQITPKLPSTPHLIHRFTSSSSDSSNGTNPIHLHTSKPTTTTAPPPFATDLPPSTSSYLRDAISALSKTLLSLPDPTPPLPPLLAAHSFPSLLALSPTSSSLLLSLLKSKPLLALSFFAYRRTLPSTPPPSPSEFSLAISLAGRARDPSLASAIFLSALSCHAPDVSFYNSLMFAYMYNGHVAKCVETFESLRVDPRCRPPTVASYNILLKLFGRSLLVDHMEATLRALDEAGVEANVETWNSVIAGYVTAWMWDKMEAAYKTMESRDVKLDAKTYLLMLRGYSNAGKIEKMEEAYARALEHVGEVDVHYLRAMVCAYCKCQHPDRVQRIEELMKKLGGTDYRAWLNVLLIRVYAQEGLVEKMERLISEAFEHNTTVVTAGVMIPIISSYFRRGAVDQLEAFVKQAEEAGWRLCRSLYHCKMVMYGKDKRLAEMRRVLDEMEMARLDRTKKTFWIMHKAYWSCGKLSEANSVFGMMWKQGFLGPEGISVQ